MLETGMWLKSSRGSYEVLRVLRISPSLITAQGREAETGRLLVIKQLLVDQLHSWKALELFERETAIMRQLQHPQIVQLVDTFTQAELERHAAGDSPAQPITVADKGESALYLICTWAEGESLLDRLEAGWRPGEDEVWEIAVQALDRLVYLQGFNPPVIHRDLKPGNLIWDPDGRLHLVDFGSVQGLLNPDGGSTVVGTFGYMPPEQFSDQCVPASDLYALGATLVHLLTGRYPSDLPRKGMKLLYRDVLSCEPFYLDWLDKLLAPEVEGRYASANEALQALEARQDVRKVKAADTRIEVSQRGTQLRIQVRPQGLSALESLYSVQSFFSLMGIWFLLWGVNLIGFGTQAPALVSLLMLGCGPLGIMLAAHLQRLIYSQIHTTLLLQPDRYRIVHRLGPIETKTEGATSELIQLKRGFSWLHFGQVLRISERSELSHLGAVNLTPAQSTELAEHVLGYLRATSPTQAHALNKATPLLHDLSPANFLRGRARQQLVRSRARQKAAAINSAEFLRKLPLGRLRDKLIAYFGQERMRITREPGRLQLHFGATAGSLGYLTVLGVWGFQYVKTSETLVQVLATTFNNLWAMQSVSADLGVLQGALMALTASGFFCWMQGLMLKGILKGLSQHQVSSRFTLDGDRFEVEHRLFGLRRRSSGEVTRLLDVETVFSDPERPARIVLSETGGKQHTLGFRLNQLETTDALNAIGDCLEQNQSRLTPRFKRVLGNWTDHGKQWSHPHTSSSLPLPLPKRISFEKGPDATEIVKIKPHDITGRPALVITLQLILTLVSLATTFNEAMIGYNLTAMIGWLVLTLCFGSAFTLNFLRSQTATTWRLQPGQLDVEHVCLGRRRRFTLNTSETQPQNQKILGGLRRSRLTQPRARKLGLSLAYLLKPEDADELLAEIQNQTQLALPEASSHAQAEAPGMASTLAEQPLDPTRFDPTHFDAARFSSQLSESSALEARIDASADEPDAPTLVPS